VFVLVAAEVWVKVELATLIAVMVWAGTVLVVTRLYEADIEIG
jgi:hypothetical protein